MSWVAASSLILGSGAALVGGVLLAFSDFVMRGLALTDSTGGIGAMQQINRTVLRSVFLTTFLLMVPAAIVMAVYAGFRLSGSVQLLLISGAAIYAVCVFGVTVFANVPMNNRLDALSAASPEALNYWETYADVWTRWNHFRTVASWLAAGCFLLAAVQAG